MQYVEQKALKRCTTLILNNLNLDGDPEILTYLVQEKVINEEDFLSISRHKTSFKQNTELIFHLKRCDARKEPFRKFCQALEQNNLHFISDKLTQVLEELNKLDMPEKQKCVFCMLVGNLYPEKIVPSLYEDSGLSSGTLEEVTLTEGVSRRAAVKTILKKLVSYQKEKGPGRECIDVLSKALPESYEYLLTYLESATTHDLQTCRCSGGQGDPTIKDKQGSQVRTDAHQMKEVTDVKLYNQKASAEGQEKVNLVRTPDITEIPINEYRRLVISCAEMRFFLDNAKWEEFEIYKKLLLAKFPDNVDMKIHVLHHTVEAHMLLNDISTETYKILQETKELIPKSQNPLFFEMNYSYTRAKVLRKERKYGVAEDHTNSFYQSSQILRIEHMIMCQQRRDAEYLTHQFQDKFVTNSVPERIFKRIEDLYLSSLHHATCFLELFRRSEGIPYNCYVSGRICLIQLAQLYLRCCVTFTGTSEDFDVDSESIAKAEQCLQKVLTRWEGISSRTEGKYLLAMSDLHLRKKQYLEALEFANEALELCNKRNQLRMVEWAERRIRFVERRIGVNGVDVDRSEVSSGCEAGPSSGVDSS